MNEIEEIQQELQNLKDKKSKSTNDMIKIKQLESKITQLENKNSNKSIGVFVNNNTVKDLKISQIKPNPYQPRKLFDNESIEHLAESISEEGLIQPIIVIQDKDGYILIAGERRLRACESLGEESIKAIIDTKSTLNDLKIKAITENLAREDLCLADEALAISSLQSTGISYSKIAQKVGKNKTHISRMINISKLNNQAIEYIRENKMSQSTSLEFISQADIDDNEKLQYIKLLNEKSLSQTKLQEMIQNNDKPKDIKIETIKINSTINGIKVSPIKPNSKKVKVELDFDKIEELNEKELFELIQKIKASVL